MQVDSDIVRRLVWTGLVAGMGALASIASTKVAAAVYRQIFDEDPPE